ncbi:MAG: isoaspartyl peptidase/L-asparaginase [Myxococcota bacterium]|nr:isoaspartyl peptidase/L-asparaginase [Myxococcota bacterium]
MILCHGGAGLVTEDRHERLRAGVRAAAAIGHRMIEEGASALDAVVAAVRVLEDDPEFNAGTGSALTIDGNVETDASVMDGATQRVGAVAAVPDLGNAIALARAVMDAGAHVILAGAEAWRFAREVGIAPAPAGSLITERARTRLAALTGIASGGTVGCVARDRAGHFAAATSTGGTAGKRAGRVGDSPVPGAGTWADARCAISATGDGEAILRTALARTISMKMPGLEPAVIGALHELARITRGSAGVIAIDRHVWIARQLAPTMPIAWVDDSGPGDSMGAPLDAPTMHDH